MDKQIIQTTIPLSPTLINEYCKGNAKGNNDIIFEFDISESPLTAAHILGYLANLKIDFRITGFDDAFFLEYLKTPFLVGESNLAKLHANLLLWKTQHILQYETINGHDALYVAFENAVIQEQMKVLNSLPLFLMESADVPGPVKAPLVGDKRDDNDDAVFENVGVNFVHLINDPEFLLKLVSPTLMNFEEQSYYTHYFDKYIYGGDKLIQFFIDNPDNLLTSAINTLLAHNG